MGKTTKEFEEDFEKLGITPKPLPEGYTPESFAKELRKGEEKPEGVRYGTSTSPAGPSRTQPEQAMKHLLELLEHPKIPENGNDPFKDCSSPTILGMV